MVLAHWPNHKSQVIQYLYVKTFKWSTETTSLSQPTPHTAHPERGYNPETPCNFPHHSSVMSIK